MTQHKKPTKADIKDLQKFVSKLKALPVLDKNGKLVRISQIRDGAFLNRVLRTDAYKLNVKYIYHQIQYRNHFREALAAWTEGGEEGLTKWVENHEKLVSEYKEKGLMVQLRLEPKPME